jgi:RING finger/CHY zinc finger protein 1
MSDIDCVVCGENLNNGIYNFTFLNCGHVIHKKCYNQMKSNGDYRCPYCKKSMWDMKDKWETIRLNIQHTPMPNDFYAVKKVSIHCNDCNQNSTTDNHYYGLECKLCKSFNTQT